MSAVQLGTKTLLDSVGYSNAALAFPRLRIARNSSVFHKLPGQLLRGDSEPNSVVASGRSTVTKGGKLPFAADGAKVRYMFDWYPQIRGNRKIGNVSRTRLLLNRIVQSGEAIHFNFVSSSRWQWRPLRRILAPFPGSAYEGNSKTGFARRIEIERVTGDHEALLRLQLQHPGRAGIGFGQELVDAQTFAGENGIPAKPVPAGAVDDQPIGQKRERHRYAVRAKRGEAFFHVQPRLETMRCVPGNGMAVRLVEGIEAHVRQKRIEAETMGVVEIVTGRTGVAEVHHGLHTAAAQIVGQRRPVPLDPVPVTGRRERIAEARVPVEDRATGVDCQGLDAGKAHGISTVAPSVLPDSMASWALTASFSGYS